MQALCLLILLCTRFSDLSLFEVDATEGAMGHRHLHTNKRKQTHWSTEIAEQVLYFSAHFSLAAVTFICFDMKRYEEKESFAHEKRKIENGMKN
jgi:hypothetical protein